jgi:Spy/CpxP family protein refolding chaperone
MRKSIIMGLGLALSLAGAAAAQQQAPDSARRNRGGDHRGEGRGGPGGFLLKDISLTDAQKAQVKQLHEANRAKMDANRDAMKKQFDEARAARQRGDTTAARAIMQRNRQAMEAARAQDVAAIRNILTADQRVQFDKNVAEMKQREAQRGDRFGDKGKGGRRGGRPGAQSQG